MPSPVAIVLAAFLLTDLLWWWWADRTAGRWRRPRAWRLLVGLFMSGQILLVIWILGGRLVAVPFPGRPPQGLGAAAYLWHLLVLPVGWAVVGTISILYATWRGGRGLVRWAAPGRQLAIAPPRVEPPESRRQFLSTLLTATPPALTSAGWAYSQTQLDQFRIRPIRLPLPGLPPELDGLRIALVSDLHVGTFTSGEIVRRVVEETSRLEADLILLPGDLINNSLADLSDALDAVCNLQSRHGAYLCVGNHDLIEDGAEFTRRVKARATLLVNEFRVLSIRGQLVQLLGLPWNRDESLMENSVHQLASQVAPGAFPILLAHHPHAFDAAAAAGLPLTVSGHTHGGQLMLGEGVGFGPLLYRYWSGPYRKPESNGAALVVSNGVGNWFPLRTQAPAEIIDLTLHHS